jgi:hypothetical protein
MPNDWKRGFSLEKLFQMRDMMNGLSDEQKKRLLFLNEMNANKDYQEPALPSIEDKNVQVQQGATEVNGGISMEDIFNSEEEQRRLRRRYPSNMNRPERPTVIQGHPFKGYL